MKKVVLAVIMLMLLPGCAHRSRACPTLPEYPSVTTAEAMGQYARTVVTLYADCAASK